MNTENLITDFAEVIEQGLGIEATNINACELNSLQYQIEGNQLTVLFEDDEINVEYSDESLNPLAEKIYNEYGKYTKALKVI